VRRQRPAVARELDELPVGLESFQARGSTRLLGSCDARGAEQRRFGDGSFSARDRGQEARVEAVGSSGVGRRGAATRRRRRLRPPKSTGRRDLRSPTA
jgi:hypothetical protein